MKNILCLSAPPGAGKDTAANFIVGTLHNIEHVKYARILKERTHALYGLTDATFDRYEGVAKDNPLPDFLGITPRQAYINVSEMLMKPVHGKTVWSDMLINQIRQSQFEHFVISDVGFQTEWDELQKQLDFRCGIIHIDRHGCNYSNDSRGPITFYKPHDYNWYVHNDDMEKFHDDIIGIAELFFGSGS